ncbi:MAG: VWA domain-containing protein [Tepidanaerobacteraceae bacterium]|nr:VWA domain-containing protein [Tepidanaerobacteraceae bacterium]
MADKPEEIHIIMNSDAGRSFYNRLNENEIIHIDLFHEIAAVDVKKTAEYLKKNILASNWKELADYIDIQTGSGGGRLSGSLNYGMSESLKKDHMNHVHLAGLIPDDKLEIVFFLVEKVEEILQQQRVELRKVERIINEDGNTPLDLSPYYSDSDSYLRQNESKSNISEDKLFRQAVSLIEHFNSIKEVENIFDFLENKLSDDDLNSFKKKHGEMEYIFKHMEQNNLIEKISNRYFLTEDGVKLKNYFKITRKELELILKKSIKHFPKLNKFGNISKVYTAKKTGLLKKGPIIIDKNNNKDWIEELDINGTVKNALVRCFSEREHFNIDEQDFVFFKHIPKMNQDICLIIDASASMAGQRLRNAKFLAKHLILNSHRRLSVMAFQERDVRVCVPFTKNFSNLDAGLDEITSTGLTPLALAIEKGLSYMSVRPVKNPLIILITDGIPTVSLWTADPIKDAINAAAKIARKKIDFCCIGLQPNKDCLINITKAAKGKLFVVDELNRDVLLEVTRKSRQLL